MPLEGARKTRERLRNVSPFSETPAIGATIANVCQACGKPITTRHGDKCSKILQKMHIEGTIKN